MKLFSESSFVADAPNVGPYNFINSIAMTTFGESRFELKPGITLRTDWYLSPDIRSMKETNDNHYHGGWADDEIAALVALIFGVRVAAGPNERDFLSDDDPLGRPLGFAVGSLPNLPNLINRPQIPSLFGRRDLRELSLLHSFPNVDAKTAVALVKSARLYQQALWIADTSPELSWLMFVSALETAANYWDATEKEPMERLERSHPKLMELLAASVEPSTIEEIAVELRELTGAAGKFLGFCEAFAPATPEKRPKFGRCSFSNPDFRKSLGKIYGYRSRALHGGTPFPAPMCRPPRADIDDSGFPQEKPLGSAASRFGATWVADDLPMLLHVFAYITRGALLNWWKSKT